MKILTILTAITLLLLSLASASAVLTVIDVQVADTTPGSDTEIRIRVENTFEDDIDDVTMSLDFTNLPLSPIGSSAETLEDIEEDDDGLFSFRARASPTAEPGDYQIPYTLSYPLKQVNPINNSQSTFKTEMKSGTIGIRIKGDVDLTTSVRSEKPILNSEDTITLKIVNTGFADARFVTVNLVSQGLTLNSDSLVHIGDIRADDFETASFDVRYTSQNPKIDAIIAYRDFENKKQSIVISETITVFTREQAIKKGILEKNNTPRTIGIIVGILILWLIWRSIKKRARLRKSMQNQR